MGLHIHNGGLCRRRVFWSSASKVDSEWMFCGNIQAFASLARVEPIKGIRYNWGMASWLGSRDLEAVDYGHKTIMCLSLLSTLP